MDGITGEYPELSPEEKIIIAFLAAITCKHGYSAAVCGQGCKQPDWRHCVVARTNQRHLHVPKCTIGDVAEEFIKAGRISSIEVLEHILQPEEVMKEEQLDAKAGTRLRERRLIFKSLATIDGLRIISGRLVFEGERVVLRLWAAPPMTGNPRG